MAIDVGANNRYMNNPNTARPRPSMNMGQPNQMKPNPMGSNPLSGGSFGGGIFHPGVPMNQPPMGQPSGIPNLVHGPSMPMPNIGALTGGTNTGFINPMSPNMIHPQINPMTMSPSMGSPNPMMGQPNPMGQPMNQGMGNPMNGGPRLWSMYNQLSQEQGMPNRRQF